MSTGSSSGLRVNRVSKCFKSGNDVVNAVVNASLIVNSGEAVAIVGPSGSGKTTLLHIIGSVLKPDEGSITYDGVDAWSLSDSNRAAFRNENFGYIFQDYALIEDENVYENIRLPLLYAKSIPRSQHKYRIAAAAGLLGIEDKLKVTSSKLSGGEKQRTAIARAIVCDQKVILADEPTGSLDSRNRDVVVDTLLDLCKNHDKTLVMVTHDLSVAERCDRIVVLEDGHLVPQEEADGEIPLLKGRHFRTQSTT